MTVPVIVRMRRMIVATVVVLTVTVFIVIVFAIVMIVLVRGHAQSIAKMMSVTLSPSRAIPRQAPDAVALR
jgi:hypothetical protein